MKRKIISILVLLTFSFLNVNAATFIQQSIPQNSSNVHNGDILTTSTFNGVVTDIWNLTTDISNLKNYSDTKDTETLNASKSYTDSRTSWIKVWNDIENENTGIVKIKHGLVSDWISVSYHDFKLNGVLKWNIAVNSSTTWNPLEINSAINNNVSIAAWGGSVGVGTNTPLAKLDVRGNILITDPNHNSNRSLGFENDWDWKPWYIWEGYNDWRLFFRKSGVGDVIRLFSDRVQFNKDLELNSTYISGNSSYWLGLRSKNSIHQFIDSDNNTSNAEYTWNKDGRYFGWVVKRLMTLRENGTLDTWNSSRSTIQLVNEWDGVPSVKLWSKSRDKSYTDMWSMYENSDNNWMSWRSVTFWAYTSQSGNGWGCWWWWCVWWILELHNGFNYSTNPKPYVKVGWDLFVNKNAWGLWRLFVEGSDFMLGTNDWRDKGTDILQRALVHFDNDTLAINYSWDFEGGVSIWGSKNTWNLQKKTALSLGDSDTGFRQNGDWVLETYANNQIQIKTTSTWTSFWDKTISYSADWFEISYDNDSAKFRLRHLGPDNNPIEIRTKDVNDDWIYLTSNWYDVAFFKKDHVIIDSKDISLKATWKNKGLRVKFDWSVCIGACW